MSDITIYTDGACSGNPGPGGWGYVILQDGNFLKEGSGGEVETTNNRMEMTAAIEALYSIPDKSIITLNSDSAYLVNAFNQKWIKGWIKNGWKTASGKPVLNFDLWQKLIRLDAYHQITWVKVKGHSGIQWNERCDKLATGAIGTSK